MDLDRLNSHKELKNESKVINREPYREAGFIVSDPGELSTN
jgi:hypothetical protein